jgi:hypothetical protein
MVEAIVGAIVCNTGTMSRELVERMKTQDLISE